VSTRDQELVAAYLTGARSAVSLVDDWLRAAAGPYRFRLGDQWEDCLQDVRIELLEHLRKGAFSGRSSLKTYVWRVVNHTCIDRMRALQRVKTVDLADADAFSSGQAGPEADFDRRQRGVQLMRVLDGSSRECRELWQMILDGWHYRQMSVVLKVSEGTVRVRVHRCRKQAQALHQKLGGAHGLS